MLYVHLCVDRVENYAERRKQMIQESKYLGGDMEHTHLVKGLDYALLDKVTDHPSISLLPCQADAWKGVAIGCVFMFVCPSIRMYEYVCVCVCVCVWVRLWVGGRSVCVYRCMCVCVCDLNITRGFLFYFDNPLREV